MKLCGVDDKSKFFQLLVLRERSSDVFKGSMERVDASTVVFTRPSRSEILLVSICSLLLSYLLLIIQNIFRDNETALFSDL